jgi:diacylglycerol O-acyltransferase / wax synthase
MPATRLSPLDDSFLGLEGPTSHMHVGWMALFDPPQDRPRPGFDELRRHVAGRVPRAPRYRQKLSPAPLEIDAPSWVDDEGFDIARHVRPIDSSDLDEAIARCMSSQLDRDRPLWEIRIADRLADGRIAVIGKAHHCMVDGIAAVELASLLLDPTPDAPVQDEDDWRPEPAPDAAARLADGLGAKARGQLRLARAVTGLALSPRRLLAVPGHLRSGVGAAGRALRPATPVEPLNLPLSPERRLARVGRPLDELRRVKSRFATTLNDVLLAVAAGAVRELLIDRGHQPVALKTMVPVSVRDGGELDELGNRISFMFVELPCDEPDPGRRLRRVHAATAQAKEGGDPGLGDFVLKLAGSAPRRVQRLVSRLMASPHMFNLVVSNIPGPSEPMYMLGCELREAYPVVPLAQGHTLSIGMTTIRDRACFGVYADAEGLGDVERAAGALDRATAELVEASEAGELDRATAVLAEAGGASER